LTLDAKARSALLGANAVPYAQVAIANIRREYPTSVQYQILGPGPLPTPREMHPAFFGSLDWHSCVLMHWVLVRLLRVFPEIAIAREMRAALDEDLTLEKLTVEARYFDEHRAFERPYGWGWALTLVNELAGWDDPDGARWRANLAPLADTLGARYVEWLPTATYPLRFGLHQNSAFGLSMALGHARTASRAGRPALEDAIRGAALRWFAADEDYPAKWEPSGADFLSPALTEAQLMRELMAEGEFRGWLSRFLPGLPDAKPASLIEPAVVSDPTDGYIAHLHGLNLSRAWCMRRILEVLPNDDPRRAALETSMEKHANASLGAAVGSDYMVEHWLAGYALLLLS
jgi:DUF2891 family protein